MDATNLTFGLNTLISIISTIAGGMGVYFTLKSKIQLLEQRVSSLEKEDNDTHIIIESLKTQVEKNKDRHDASIDTIKESMNAMEIRIIEAIHKIKP